MTSAIATSAALAACGDNTSVGAATDDGPGDGSCVEIEPMRAYRTCVSDAPLSVPGADATATRTITATVPDVDHRVDYLDGCLVVHDQGDSGWCALHAVAAAHEALHCQRGEQASVSPPHIKYRRVGRDFTSDDIEHGMSVNDAMTAFENGYVADNDSPSVSAWPNVPAEDYSSIGFPEPYGYLVAAAKMNDGRPKPDATLDSDAAHGTSGFTWLGGNTVDGIKAALQAGYEVVIDTAVIQSQGPVAVWSDVDAADGTVLSAAGFIDYPGQPVTCACQCPKTRPKCTNACRANAPACVAGYHATTVVGYHDDPAQPGGGYLRFANSWGDGWANGGYGMMTYDYYAKYGRNAFRFDDLHDRHRAATQVSATASWTKVVHSDGTVRSWGWNGDSSTGDGVPFGYLATGDLAHEYAQPGSVVGLTDVVRISLGPASGASCGVRRDGSLACWDGGFAFTGNPGPAGQVTIIYAPTPQHPQKVIDMANANWTYCLLFDDHTISCKTTLTPQPFTVALGDVVELSGGGQWRYPAAPYAGVPYFLARAADGTVWLFGDFGSGLSVSQQAGVVATQISAGVYHACAVTTTGSVTCWGNDLNGELGNGQSGYFPTPFGPQVVVDANGPLTDVKEVSAGNSASCAVKGDGSLWCWGANSLCYLSSACSGSSSVAVHVLDDVAHVSVGLLHVCAIKRDGTTWCWGDDASGEMGTGHTGGNGGGAGGTAQSTPIQVD